MAGGLVSDRPPMTGRDWLGVGVAGAGLLPMLFGGSGDDEINKAIGDLREHAKTATDLSKTYNAQGAEMFAPVADYLKKVTSGDRQAVLQATMPERRRVIDQYATAKKAIAEFTPRSGGQAAAGAQLQAKEAGDLAETTASARQAGFGQAADLSKAAATLGISAEQLASGDLNSIINALTAQQAAGANSAAGLGQALGTLAGFLLF